MRGRDGRPLVRAPLHEPFRTFGEAAIESPLLPRHASHDRLVAVRSGMQTTIDLLISAAPPLNARMQALFEHDHQRPARLTGRDAMVDTQRAVDQVFEAVFKHVRTCTGSLL